MSDQNNQTQKQLLQKQLSKLRENLDDYDPFNKDKNESETKPYQIATIDGIDVYLHEAIYVLTNKKPIPTNHIVMHLDGNTLNNHQNNLVVAPMQKRDFDLRKTKHMIFHKNQYRKNKLFIKKHFNDVYNVLFTPETNKLTVI